MNHGHEREDRGVLCEAPALGLYQLPEQWFVVMLFSTKDLANLHTAELHPLILQILVKKALTDDVR